MDVDLKTLIGKLNTTSRKGLEAAAALCVSQTHYNVEIEHLLLKLLEGQNTDLHRLLRYYEVKPADVAGDLTRAMEKFKRGNSRTPALTPHILQLLREAWTISTLQFGMAQIRTGAILLSLFQHETLRGLIVDSAPALLRIPGGALREDIKEIMKGSSEEAPGDSAGLAKESWSGGAGGTHRGESSTPALDQYTIDLTARGRAGQLDPIRGRDAEIRQVIDILMRRRQNNPILTGEAGVGKTAVVEGFALRVAHGDVPPALEPVGVRMLDLGLLQAGAGIRGEFEERLKKVITEVKSSPQPIILFIDEAHTMIGAGGPAGHSDAANLLKPALARGELRTIAATTWGEYKKYFEKDAALARRFQVVKVEEPDEAAAVEMLRGVAGNLETHHRVHILDEALRDAVRLSHRYISERYLPDKAISVLDTACARVAVSHNGTPPAIEDTVRTIEGLDMELSILTREQRAGRDHAARIAELMMHLDRARQQHKELQVCWERERATVQKIWERQATLRHDAEGETGTRRVQVTEELTRLEKDLEALQGQTPMVPLCVDSRVVATVVSGWTGIPVGRMLTDEIHTLLELKGKLCGRIIGQPEALETICRRIKTYGAHLDDPGKPVGVFLLVGPSGVGKTETAVGLADLLYGGERNLVVLNMSEYQEAYTVSKLKGSPAGYVGYGAGGVLTEAVRRNPYSVILFDEVEKAHPDVIELFYQVFDKGTLEDSEGLAVDFRNTIILLTSNLGGERLFKACSDVRSRPDPGALVDLIRPQLLKHFNPAFLGRLVIVPYFPLKDVEIQQIVKLKLAKIRQRFQEQHRVTLTYAEDLVSAVAARCVEVETGARNIDHILTQSLLPEVATEVLRRMASGEPSVNLHVELDRAGHFVCGARPQTGD